MRSRIVESKFVCPNCGGTLWGTSGCTGPTSRMVGHCHGGLGGVGCGFSWPRNDDWRYFVFTIRPTRAEYAKLEGLRRREQARNVRVVLDNKSQEPR